MLPPDGRAQVDSKPQKQPRLPPGGRPVQIGEVATSWQAGAERRFFTSRLVCQSSAMRDANNAGCFGKHPEKFTRRQALQRSQRAARAPRAWRKISHNFCHTRVTQFLPQSSGKGRNACGARRARRARVTQFVGTTPAKRTKDKKPRETLTTSARSGRTKTRPPGATHCPGLREQKGK